MDLPWLVLLLLLLLALFGWWRAATHVGRSNRGRLRVAQAGESAAEAVLAEQGYEVVDRQVTVRWSLTVDGEVHEVASRADLLVTRDGLDFVAEVKTGERAPDPRRPATRRQLLEYLHVFDVEGVLLVDMETGRVHRVAFPVNSRSTGASGVARR